MRIFFIYIFLFFLPTPLLAQVFGNNTVQLPSVGLLRMKSFDIDNQVTVGAQYAGAVTYSLWWTAETAVGFGRSLEDEGGKRRLVASAHALVGIRYFPIDTVVRPFLGVGLHYLHILGRTPAPWVYTQRSPMWVGGSPSLGLEWQFAKEMSFQLEGVYGIYVNFTDPFQQTFGAKLSYNLYF